MNVQVHVRLFQKLAWKGSKLQYPKIYNFCASTVDGVRQTVKGTMKVLLPAVLLPVSTWGASAAPWTVQFGLCTFSGDDTGAPLVRTGSCDSEAGSLDLASVPGLGERRITSLPADAFRDMSNMT